MDNQKKKRPVGRRPEQRSGQSPRKPEEGRKRQDTSRQTSRQPDRRRPEEAASRRPDPRQQDKRRRPEEKRPPRRNAERKEPVAGNIPAAPRQVPQTDAPEMVFAMDGKKQRDQKKPRSPEAARRDSIRRRAEKHTEERKKKARSKAPKVTYTQPRPFNLNRLLLQLAIVLAVVLAITVGLSVFFKVDKIMVYGNNAYSAWAVRDASGIQEGERLLSFGKIRAIGRIKADLPYVDSVRIGINLPDTVNIYIKEVDVAYAIKSQNGTFWLITSDGRVVEQADAGKAGGYTNILGVELRDPVPGEDCIAFEQLPESKPETETDAPETEAGGLTLPGETEPIVVTGADRLNAALTVLKSLELNDIVGEAASVDVTYVNDIELWYGSRYQVKLGDTSQMDFKISSMKQAIAQLHEYQMGILDASFTTWPDQLSYTPFE